MGYGISLLVVALLVQVARAILRLRAARRSVLGSSLSPRRPEPPELDS